MATTKTFDVSRVGGGTYELERDATTGNYSLKSVGFDKINKLNLPDLASQDAATTTTTAKTDTTTDTTTDTAAPYKQLAQANLGGDTQQDYGSMLKNQNTATDTTTSMTKGGTFSDARQAMTSDDAYRGKTESFPGRSKIDPTNPLDTVYEDAIMRGGKGATYQPKRNEKSIFVDDQGNMYKGGEFIGTGNIKSIRTGAREGTEFARPKAGTIDQMAADATKFPGRSRTMGGPALGITSDRVPDAIKAGQPAAPDRITGLQKAKSKASDALKKLSNLSPIKIAGNALGVVLGAITPERTATQQVNIDHFNIRPGDSTGQRIAGNPAEDLYAGMNRNSAFGNLEKAGNKRLNTRRATIARRAKTDRPVSQKFIDDTKKMEQQQRDYQKAKEKKTSSNREKARMNQPGGGGNDSGGSDSGRVICTELHRTKEMATHDWVRDIKFTYKNLSKDHIKGYLFWAVPTVKHIQKYPRYRKIWKHIAQHRANDIAWRLNQGRFDLLGRIYAGIGEPLCWLIGKCVSDKQLKELKLNSWRRA